MSGLDGAFTENEGGGGSGDGFRGSGAAGGTGERKGAEPAESVGFGRLASLNGAETDGLGCFRRLALLRAWTVPRDCQRTTVASAKSSGGI